MDKTIKNAFKEHQKTFDFLQEKTGLLKTIAEKCIDSLNKGGKIIFCGNGGSAADSQHLAAELVGRFKKERGPLPAIALSVNTSVITALANDYNYDCIFSRQISALSFSQDVLIAISTSGNSRNILKAVETAKAKKIPAIALIGKDGGKLKALADISLVIDSEDTARIQEMHILAGHIICELIEDNFSE